MSSHSPLRPLGLTVAAAALIGVAIDAGSVTLARLAADHNVESVGVAAAESVKSRPITSDTAALALKVARSKGRLEGLRVQGGTFRLYRDGRLHLTASAKAPTVLLKHVEPLRHLTSVSVSATVVASPYS